MNSLQINLLLNLYYDKQGENDVKYPPLRGADSMPGRWKNNRKKLTPSGDEKVSDETENSVSSET